MTNYSFSKIFDSNPGWYRGDFHAHTTDSDGIYPPSVVVEIAKTEGLDFITITDHNTIEGLSKLKGDLDLLVIPGVEVSFDNGHFNVFGADGWRDWMEGIHSSQGSSTLSDKYPSITELVHHISSEGLLNSINHPFLFPWQWQLRETDLRHIDCLEIWNDLCYPDNALANPKAVALWSKWLNAGYRITAIGGSDYHYPCKEDGKSGEHIGYPTTYVYAETLSVAGLLDGLRKQRAYVSRGLPLSFEAHLNGRIYGIGADLGEVEGQIEFRASILSGFNRAQVKLVKNGEIVAARILDEKKGKIFLSEQAAPAGQSWYRLEVYDLDGQVLVITNPIFVGPRKEPTLLTYGDFV